MRRRQADGRGIGAAALLILIILAATSFRAVQWKMGKGWVRLHRLTYLAGLLVVAHYLLAVKGDLLTLQGDYTTPLAAAGVLIVALVLRLPFINKRLKKRA